MAVLNCWQVYLTLFLFLVLSLSDISSALIDSRVSSEKSEDILGKYLNDALFGSTHSRRQNDGCTPEPNCSPSTCTNTVCSIAKRKTRALPPNSIGDSIGSSNLTEFELELDVVALPPGIDKRDLAKRFLRTPILQNTINTYLQGQNGRADLINLCPSNAGGYDTPSFCVSYPFGSSAPVDPSTGQLLIGTGNTELTGCTVLTIASSRGVYMCHFWQDLNYPNADNGRPDRPALGFQPVLNMLRGEGDRRWAVGPAIDKQMFTGLGVNTWAFICTPRSGSDLNDPNRYHYTTQQDQLVAVLKEMIPDIGIVNYNYNWKQPYTEYYQGVALFEYDKNADNKGSPDWRLWLEMANERGRRLGQDPA